VVLYFQSPSRVATTEEEEEEVEEAPLLKNKLSPEESEREAGSHKRDCSTAPLRASRKRENRKWELMGTYGGSL
jgi:hypothetical protein